MLGTIIEVLTFGKFYIGNKKDILIGSKILDRWINE